MYKISVISSDSSISERIAASPVWQRLNDFEYAGSITDGHEAVDFLKRTGAAMVFIYAADINNAQVSTDDIMAELPGIYIVLVSEDTTFEAVRGGFISGIFDYLPLPLYDSGIEEILLRLYSDMGSRYINRDLKDIAGLLAEAVAEGSLETGLQCGRVLDKIYEDFGEEPFTAYMVAEKAKTYIYDELMRRLPWLRKFVYKNNFAYCACACGSNREGVYRKWTESFCAAADTVRKYAMLDNPLINNIGFYIINHVDERLSLEEVSGGVFLNKSYISHIFKKVSGVSLVNFITEVKMDRAKILLMDPEIKIYEIASVIGYNNPEYFSRVFKSVTGITPNRYRSMIKAPHN